MHFGAITRDDRFHEIPVKILQGTDRRVAQAAVAFEQPGSDKGEPDFAHHSYFWPEPGCRAARVQFQKFVYVRPYCRREHLDGNSNHTKETLLIPAADSLKLAGTAGCLRETGGRVNLIMHLSEPEVTRAT
jgi:hypothetical protein